MPEENSYGDYTTITNFSREEQIREKAADGIETSQHAISSMQGKTGQTAGVLSPRSETPHLDRGRERRDYPHTIFGLIKYAWDNFLPLSWLGYSLAALNIVPITILIGFLVGTLAFVLVVC